jgi:hypothetical protein
MSSATDQLQRLEEAVAFAKGREDAVLAARSRASRAVSAAEGALALYHEAVGAGEDEDPAEEEHLRLAVRDAREQGEPPVWNAKLGGALRAREDAERERDAYGREHFGEIAAEQAPLDPPVAERLQAAWEELRAAEGAYADRVRVWTRIVQYGDLTAEDVPRLPTSGDPDTVRSRFAAGVEVPTPRPLNRAKIPFRPWK